MSTDISSIEKQLESILAALEGLKKTAKSYDELNPLQDKLRQIDSLRKDGKFVDAKGEVPAGQAKLHDLISRCYEVKEEIVARLG